MGKIGRLFPKKFITKHPNSACKNSKTHRGQLKKETGQKRRMKYYFLGLSSMVLLNGLSAQNLFKEGAENNAERDG